MCASDQRGFTLIELLVVIMIIGILTAIALPAFLNQRMDAADGNAKALARTGANALQTYALQNGNYNAAPAAVLDIAPELSSAPSWLLTVTDDTYSVSVTSSVGHTFTLGRKVKDGAMFHECTTGADPAGSGGCKSDGTW